MKRETISQEEAAELLDISLSTLYRRRAKDKADKTYGLREPGGFRDGGDWLWKYRIEDVRDWLARRARRNLVAAGTSVSEGQQA